MGLLQKLTGFRHHPAEDMGATGHCPAHSAHTDSKPGRQRAKGGWFALFADKALDGPETASGPLPDLSEALRSHRRKTRHEWLDSAPVQTELLEAFHDVFDETMTDGLGLSDAAGPDNLLAVPSPAQPSPMSNPPMLNSAIEAAPADQPTEAAEEEVPDGFTMLFRAHG
jgi:hypothetical protein